MRRPPATPAEIARIKELGAQGLSPRAIARVTGRDIGTVKYWLHKQPKPPGSPRYTGRNRPTAVIAMYRNT